MRKVFSLFTALCCCVLCACATNTDSGAIASEDAQVSSALSSVSQHSGVSLPISQAEDAGPLSAIHYPLPEAIASRITGSSWAEDAPVKLDELAYIIVPCVDFEGRVHTGEMVVHHTVAQELVEIFEELFDAEFPIAGMSLIDDYGADDMVSMEANNSYCFCSRLILGTDRYSVHSYGFALDINPVQNPYISGGSVYPDAAAEYLDREDLRPGMIVEGDACYNAFTSRGWSWGGHWPNPDYQHFEKEII